MRKRKSYLFIVSLLVGLGLMVSPGSAAEVIVAKLKPQENACSNRSVTSDKKFSVARLTAQRIDAEHVKYSVSVPVHELIPDTDYYLGIAVDTVKDGVVLGCFALFGFVTTNHSGAGLLRFSTTYFAPAGQPQTIEVVLATDRLFSEVFAGTRPITVSA